LNNRTLPGWLPEAHRRFVGLFKSTEEVRQVTHSIEVGELLQVVREHFAAINVDETLTAEDKSQLKNFYLEHLMAPKAQALFAKHFPEEAAAAANRPQKKRKVWIDPNGHALAFLKKYQDKPASQSS
jgi:hypothetical protein